MQTSEERKIALVFVTRADMYIFTQSRVDRLIVGRVISVAPRTHTAPPSAVPGSGIRGLANGAPFVSFFSSCVEA